MGFVCLLIFSEGRTFICCRGLSVDRETGVDLQGLHEDSTKDVFFVNSFLFGESASGDCLDE